MYAIGWEANTVKDFWPHFIIVQMEWLYSLPRPHALLICHSAHTYRRLRMPDRGSGGSGWAAVMVLMALLKTSTYSKARTGKSKICALLANKGGGLVCYRRSLSLALFTIQLRLTLIIKRPLNFTEVRGAPRFYLSNYSRGALFLNVLIHRYKHFLCFLILP